MVKNGLIIIVLILLVMVGVIVVYQKIFDNESKISTINDTELSLNDSENIVSDNSSLNNTTEDSKESNSKLIVAKTGDAKFRTIQSALDMSQPGDIILVRDGVYKEKLEWNTSGTESAPIILKNYPRESPVIEPLGTNYKDYVAMNGQWLILEGFEIRNGWDGVVINASNNIIRGNHIHNNGDACLVKVFCGQGILIVSASNITIEDNLIEHNGLINYSPWHVHGIYVSDYYKKGISNIVIKENVLREHGGAGIHLYNPTQRINGVYIEDNTFENNALEMVLTNVDNAKVSHNMVVHNSYPPTDAPRTAVIWIEQGKNILFEYNIFKYGIPKTEKLPAYLVYYGSQDKKQLTFLNNTWEMSGDYPNVTDLDIVK